MTNNKEAGEQARSAKSEQPILLCSFCGADQNHVRQLIGGPNGIFICDGCVLICVNLIEESSETLGRPAFRHCLTHANEPRYDELQAREAEQRKLLEAAETLVPEQYTALRESIATLLRPNSASVPPPTKKKRPRK